MKFLNSTERLKRRYFWAYHRFFRWIKRQSRAEQVRTLSVENERLPRKVRYYYSQIERIEQALVERGVHRDEISKISGDAVEAAIRTPEPFVERLRRRWWDEIEFLQKLGWGIGILGLALIVIGFVVVQSQILKGSFVNTLVNDLYANLGAEALGIAATILVVDRFYRQLSQQERKNWLLLQLKHSNRDIAFQAYMELIHNKMFFDGALDGESMAYTKLPGIKMQLVRLIGVDLTGADLRNIEMIGGDLQWAMLRDANLANAKLHSVNFRNADFGGTNLDNADMEECDVLGASFVDEIAGIDPHTNQPKTYYYKAKFTLTSKLPDGSFWNENTDLRYFTDKDFPGGVWRSSQEYSPAYIGLKDNDRDTHDTS